MSIGEKSSKHNLIERVLMAGRENGIRSILFQQTVGQILGLSAIDMKCLDVIYLSGPASPTQLSKLTGLTSGAVTTLVDRLERAELIERMPDPEDRRRTVLLPTEKAGREIPGFYKSMGSAMGKLASKLSERELLFLEQYLTQTAEVFKRETEKLRPQIERRKLKRRSRKK